MRAAGWSFALGLAAASPLVGAGHDFLAPSQIRYDARCLTIEGQDRFISSVPFDYAAVDPKLWRKRLESIKAGGFNAVSAAVTDPAALAAWLRLVHEEFGLYTILRPPAATIAAAAAAIVPGQITRRRGGHGGTILVQVPGGPNLAANYAALVAAGIEVPIFSMGSPECRDSDNPQLGRIFDELSFLPSATFERRIGQMTALESAQPDAPVLIDQTQFLPDPTLELAQALLAVQQGATILDFAWPNPAGPEAVALNRLLARYGAELARSHPVTIQAQTGNAEVTLAVRRARNGATYLFFDNRSASGPRRGRASLWLDHDGVEIGVDYELPPSTAKVKRFPPDSTNPAEAEWILLRK